MASDSAPGTIVTFYSYKGGTGRTMALANVAWILASAGKRVLVVDWDLDSPGLHRYLHPFLLDKDLSASDGVMEMVRNYASAALYPDSTGERWIVEQAQVLQYATSLDWAFPEPGGIDLLPAGRQDARYSRTVSTFDWPSFYERLGGGQFIDALARDMREHYDYVLIDSRTGLGDVAGICTVQLPDVVVNCFTLSTQSIEGAVAVARSIRAQRRMSHATRILPVPMRVEDAEQAKLDFGRDYARHEFASFLGTLDVDETNRYWGDVEIPYKPFFAYEEILAPFADRPMAENTLLSSYERLTSVLTGGAVAHMRPMEERDRRRWLLEFERSGPATPTDVTVSYAQADRMWAEWIAAQLTGTGLNVVLHDVDFGAGPEPAGGTEPGPAAADRTLVLLSRDYMSSANAAAFWHLAGRHESGERSPLVAIRLDTTRPVPPFTDRTPVDLVGVQAERAREVLLAALGRPVPIGAGPDATRSGPRYPATLPPHWNAPPRNDVFTGRSTVLEELRGRLTGSITAVVPQALSGLGGIGKTQIAVEYAYRFAANYDLVWWINAEQTHQIRTSLDELCRELNLPTGENMNDNVGTVLDALRRGRPTSRWLLIFDNAGEPGEIREFLPQGAGHVLLTSRLQAWNREARAVEIDVFERAESVQFLTRQVGGLGPEEASLVAERLGDLPLAVEQAGAWLFTTGMPVGQYLELLDTQLLQVLDENPPSRYDTTTATTWRLSLERLRHETPAAAKLLEVCAFFAPEPIPTSLIFSAGFTELLLPYDRTLRDPILQGRLVREIGRYSLASVDPVQASVQMHRLVQAVVQDSLSPQEQTETRRQAQQILAAAPRGNPDIQSSWPAYAMLWPHVRRTGALASDDIQVRLLVIDVVRYLYRRGDFTGSRDLAAEVRKLWKSFVGNDPTTLLLGFHLGNALWSLAAYEEATQVDERTIQELTTSVGADHEYTIMAAGGLAADYRALGRYSEARTLDEETLVRATETFGEFHDRTLLIANNVGVSMRLTGAFQEAAEIDEATLLNRRRHFGDTHPNTLLAIRNFGDDLRALGRYPESQSLLEQLVETYRAQLGEDHVDTLRAASHLSVTLRKIGDVAAANTLTVDTLRRFVAVSGPDHPDALSCVMNQACEESALGDSSSAAATAQKAIEGYRRVFRPDHPLFLAGLNNLSIFVRLSGDRVIAQMLAQEALDGFDISLGPRHPYTGSCRITLANLFFEQGDHERAARIDQEAYQLLSEVLGADNPDVLIAAGNRVVSLRAAGHHVEAQALSDDALTLSGRLLGEAHPITNAVREERRLDCDISSPSF